MSEQTSVAGPGGLEHLRGMVPLREWMLQHRFASFFIILMVIQQVCITYKQLDLPGNGYVMRLEMLGPMMAALFMIWLQHGLLRVQDSFRKLAHWRVNPIWYVHAVLWMPLAAFLGVVVRNLWLGQPVWDVPTYWGVIPDTDFFSLLASFCSPSAKSTPGSAMASHCCSLT